MSNPSKNNLGIFRAALGALIIIAALWWLGFGLPANSKPSSTAPKELVVYCAHDSLYSEPILRAFSLDTGISVDIRFDTEATKSLGLVELIARERDNPRCDVFWNNEVLGTQDLQRQGLLEPYQGLGYARIPDQFKDPSGYWAGFAARLRVWIVNTDMHDASKAAIESTLEQPDLSRVTMAKPLYGTTRTHYTMLWHLWGPSRLQQWHKDWRTRGLIEAPSNGRTMGLVAAGTCAIGWTDTDDYFVALDRGDPVAMVPATVEGGQTICIPNTVAIIKGTKNMDAAQRLVNYLLSVLNRLWPQPKPAVSPPPMVDAPIKIIYLPQEAKGTLPDQAPAYIPQQTPLLSADDELSLL